MRFLLARLVQAGVLTSVAASASLARAQQPSPDGGTEVPTQEPEKAAQPEVAESVPPDASPPAPLPPLAPEVAPPAPTNLGSVRAYVDYSDGHFYLRSAGDKFLLTTGGRVHVDTYAFAGPGVEPYRRANGTGLKANMFFRRFILETGGIVRQHWFFWVGGNFAPTQIDLNQVPTSTAAVYDGFIGYQSNPWFQFYAGQYNAPYTMENVTSSRWLDLMERALVIRTVATPYNKDLGIMHWGATRDGAAPLEYQVGVFGGDGMNRPSVDNRFDAMGRVIVRPASAISGALQRLHVGASARIGSRDPNFVSYDAPTLSTPGGYAFWSPVYTTEDKTEIHVVPSGNQFSAAAELYVPIDRLDLKGELVYVREGRREAASADRFTTLRKGLLEGVGGYLQLSFWPLGSPRVNGHPAGRYFGYRPPKNSGAELPFGLQLVARLEILRLRYDGNERSPEVDAGRLSATNQDIKVNAYQLGLNYWATKHIRLTAEYSLYAFPGESGTNQALAPGAKAPASNASANHLHEVSFRFGLAM